MIIFFVIWLKNDIYQPTNLFPYRVTVGGLGVSISDDLDLRVLTG